MRLFRGILAGTVTIVTTIAVVGCAGTSTSGSSPTPVSGTAPSSVVAAPTTVVTSTPSPASSSRSPSAATAAAAPATTTATATATTTAAAVVPTSTVETTSSSPAPPAEPAAAPVTLDTLQSAEVSDGYGTTAGPMQDGERDGDGGGFIGINPASVPALGDFTGDGIDDGVAGMEGSSGVGGTWEWVNLYTDGGRLLGRWDGMDTTGARMSFPSVAIADQAIQVEWTAQDMSHPDPTSWQAVLSWDGQQIVVEEIEQVG